MKNKKWCVHVYQVPYCEVVTTTTAEEAESLVMNREFAGNYDEISEVEVMRECECGNDNDKDRPICWSCAAKL